MKYVHWYARRVTSQLRRIVGSAVGTAYPSLYGRLVGSHWELTWEGGGLYMARDR